MKKMRHSDEHKKRWFLLSVVDLSYYKSYQVSLEREGGREEGGREREEKTLFLSPSSTRAKVTSHVNLYL